MLTAAACAGPGQSTQPTSTALVVGLADVVASPFALLQGVIVPLRSGACTAFSVPRNYFSVDPSSSHTDALDFLPSLQARYPSLPEHGPGQQPGPASSAMISPCKQTCAQREPDHLCCLQGDPWLVQLYSLLRYLPGVSYLRAVEIVARLPGDVELDITRGTLDDGPTVSKVRRRLARILVSSDMWGEFADATRP